MVLETRGPTKARGWGIYNPRQPLSIPLRILPLEVICSRVTADVMSTLRDDEDTKRLVRKRKRAQPALGVCAAGEGSSGGDNGQPVASLGL